MSVLHVNVDHVATIRETRKTTEPDPVFAALLAEQAGASGITIHLREDRRHIQDRDVRLARETIQTRLNLEMAPIDEMVEIALKTKPDIVTLVPEKRTEVTTEGGLNCLTSQEELKTRVGRLRDAGILVSLFIDPDETQIDATKKIEADEIELHTGEYANAEAAPQVLQCLERLQKAADYGTRIGLQVNAGHGLTYFNVKPVARIPEIKELNIGHSVISRAAYVGITQAVREMVEILGVSPSA